MHIYIYMAASTLSATTASTETLTDDPVHYWSYHWIYTLCITIHIYYGCATIYTLYYYT